MILCPSLPTMHHLSSCRELLAVNPDNYRHHTALRQAAGMPDDSTAELTGEQRSRMVELYHQLQADHPRSSAAFRIPLDFEVGSPYRTHVPASVADMSIEDDSVI